MRAICKIYDTQPEQVKTLDLGCDVIMLYNSDGTWLKNTSNGAIRQIRKGRVVYGFRQEDYDWEAIGRLAHNNDAYSGNLNYGGISRWDDYIDGFCALSWTLYPDGRYFADSDGYGGDDNDEVVIYVILNADLEVIQPWQPISNIREILSQLRKSRQTNCG